MTLTKRQLERQRYREHGGNPSVARDLFDRNAKADACRALLRRQLVYGQHGFTDPADYGAACQIAGLPA